MKEVSAIIRWGERWGLTLRWMCQEPESQEPKAAQEEKEKLSAWESDIVSIYSD